VAEQARQWGAPVYGGRSVRGAVLGLGKLGSGELTYASDMDVLFVCDPGGACPKADKDGEAFWTRVAQELMRCMQEGRLYAIDPRLRPWGEQGQLVVNLETLRGYWSEPRDLWERMANLRVAYLAGDPRLADEAIAIIRSAALGQPLPGDAAAQVRDMRRRLEQSVAGRDHLKRGPGGYVDHEFIAQYRALGLASEALPVGSSILQMLERLTELGRIPAAALTELRPGLELLRRVESRQRLHLGKAVSSLDAQREQRILIARRCGFTELDDFENALATARQNARRWFEALIV